MWTWIIIAIVAVLIIDVISLIWWKSTTIHSTTFGLLNFAELKRQTNMNIFGMLFIGLLLNILMLPISIVYWLHLACTWHPKKRNG